MNRLAAHLQQLVGDAKTERLLAFGDAWNRRDVDDIMSYFAVECTYHASAGPEPGRTYEGREAPIHK